jgi:hypothetical protein
MTVRHVLVKPGQGTAMRSVGRIALCTTEGIVGGARCAPLRQLLLLESADLRAFRLDPGDLRENAVLDFPGLDELPSGTELQIGSARIRLTFHCEPCARVTRFARASELLHRRGYLACVSAAGTIGVGDAVTVTGHRFEAVPYAVRERLAWYLNRRVGQVPATELLWEIGVPRSYARALPSLLRAFPDSLREKVRFKREK